MTWKKRKLNAETEQGLPVNVLDGIQSSAHRLVYEANSIQSELMYETDLPNGGIVLGAKCVLLPCQVHSHSNQTNSVITFREFQSGATRRE